MIASAMLGLLATITAPGPASAPPSQETIATCLAQRHPRDVDLALQQRAIAGLAPALRGIKSAGCPVLVVDESKAMEQRGVLFAAMYRRYGPQAGRAAANIINRWQPRLQADDPRAGWYAVSDCLVGRAPEATRKLVRAADASEEEGRQLARVVGEMPKCLQAQQFRISRPLLKGLIAETVYEIDFAYTPGNRRF